MSCTHNHPEFEGGTVSAYAVFENKFFAAIGCGDQRAAEEAAANMQYYCAERADAMREVIARFQQPIEHQPTAETTAV